jgi:hypothetical protein
MIIGGVLLFFNPAITKSPAQGGASDYRFRVTELAGVVHFELNRVSRHVQALNFSTLEVDVTLNHVFSEDATASQKLMVIFQAVQRFLESLSYDRDVESFFLRQIVQVFVHGIARMDLVLNAVEAGHQHGRERKVRVR